MTNLTVLETHAHALEMTGRCGIHDAIACWKRIIELTPTHAMAWSHVGMCLFALGIFDEALAKFDVAIRLDPRIKYAWVGRANCKMMLGTSKDTEGLLSSALEDLSYVMSNTIDEDANSTENARNGERQLKEHVLYARGSCLFAMHRYHEAADDLTRLIRINALLPGAALLRGMCHARLGAHSAAITDYTRAILLLSPMDVCKAGVWKLRADSHHALNNHDAVLSDLSTAICMTTPLAGQRASDERNALIREFSRLFAAQSRFCVPK